MAWKRPDGTLIPASMPSGRPLQRMETDMNVSAMNDNEKIEAMAAAMRRFGEGCTREQLNLYFPNADIDRLHEQARMKANDEALMEAA
ncbi:hypothetical protein QE432_001093 [Agrobacterium sp. SORGH_AS 745]|nr:hypothetical protein [Agrobacterium tumefaciens]MDQ1219535.1 hypothetical protein [Agrobacterium sp. SORGH_AS_0745]